ncbi:hypothetical protein CSKR_104964 [Clonorchis sinensis]|uniref:Uncharacterized protein n=1 Tax=Clonorchis sinensis TaxID=79923 RepID=A0A419Q6M3_CLOSI|nr:hypothetical protein CSKR_104964 [Clonorchis sinensis]
MTRQLVGILMRNVCRKQKIAYPVTVGPSGVIWEAWFAMMATDSSAGLENWIENASLPAGVASSNHCMSRRFLYKNVFSYPYPEKTATMRSNQLNKAIQPSVSTRGNFICLTDYTSSFGGGMFASQLPSSANRSADNKRIRSTTILACLCLLSLPSLNVATAAREASTVVFHLDPTPRLQFGQSSNFFQNEQIPLVDDMLHSNYCLHYCTVLQLYFPDHDTCWMHASDYWDPSVYAMLMVPVLPSMNVAVVRMMHIKIAVFLVMASQEKYCKQLVAIGPPYSLFITPHLLARSSPCISMYNHYNGREYLIRPHCLSVLVDDPVRLVYQNQWAVIQPWTACIGKRVNLKLPEKLPTYQEFASRLFFTTTSQLLSNKLLLKFAFGHCRMPSGLIDNRCADTVLPEVKG